MTNKPNEWQRSEVLGGDCYVDFNVAIGEIVIQCNDSVGFTSDQLALFMAELERKGMYDG